MSKLFNNNTNATVNNNNNNNQSQVEDQKNNKFGWLKTGALVISGAAATVGAVIGARKLYEHFTDLDGELDGDQFEEDPEIDQDQTTPDSEVTETVNFNFNEVDTEPTIFTTANEVVDETPEVTETSEKPVDPVVPGTFDPIEGYRLPEGRSWKSLVRPEIFEITKDLEDEINKLDFNESSFVIRCANSVFDRAESVANISEWERLYLDNLYEDFYSYIGYAMDAIADRYKETHQFEDLALAKALFDEFTKSPLCTFRVGKKLKTTLKSLTEEAKKLASSDDPEKESGDVTDNDANEEEVVAGDSHQAIEESSEEPSTDAEAETAATVAETVPASEVTKDDPQSDEPTSDNSDNSKAIDQFAEDMDFLKKLMRGGNYKGAQTFFRDTFSSYLVDENVSDEIKSELDGIRATITDKLTAKRPVPQKKKGGKRNYKRNGRK